MARSSSSFVLAPGRAKVLFDLRPGFFDGIEIGRVGRQIEHFRSPRLDPFAHPVDLVRTEVVHHHHVAGSERGAQDMFDVGEEDIGVGRFLDGHRRIDSAQTHCRQNGQDLPVAAGRRFVDSATIDTASIEPRHRGCDTALVQENQVFRRDRPDALDELLPPVTVGLGVALGGVERLFLRRTPSRFSTFHT